MTEAAQGTINKDCFTWRAHLSWFSAFSLLIASALLAMTVLWIEGVYSDVPPVSEGQQLLAPSAADPHPTFFIIREGDKLTLIRNRTPIAYLLTGLFGIVILFLLTGIYQSLCCAYQG